MFYKELLVKREKNKYIALPDNMKGIAVLTMILIHVFNQYANHEVLESSFFPVLDFLAGPPAAPVFMAWMGYFFYQKNPSFRQGVVRGIRLIMAGYMLNFFKGFLPVMLAKHWLRFPENYFPDLYTGYYLIFNVEIWILAGLSFLLMSLVNRFTRKPLWIGLTALCVAGIAPYLWGWGEELPIIKHLILPLWGKDTDLAIFPLFPWGFYPLIGLMAASVHSRIKEKGKTSVIVAALGISLFLIGGSLLLIDFDRFFNDYGQQSWGALIAFTGFVLLWGLLIHQIQKIYPNKWKSGFLRFCSRNLPTVYFIQWILAGWLFLLIPYHSLNYLQCFLITLAVIILTCLGTAGINAISVTWKKGFPKKPEMEAHRDQAKA